MALITIGITFNLGYDLEEIGVPQGWKLGLYRKGVIAVLNFFKSKGLDTIAYFKTRVNPKAKG